MRPSENGGQHPRWRGDGRELYFQSGSDALAVSVADADAFRGGRPRRLFTIESSYAFQDATPDGERLLVLADAARGDAQPLHVMLDWKAFIAR